MAKAREKSDRKHGAGAGSGRATSAPGGYEWLTQAAFLLALALVVARLTFSDGSRLRDFTPGGIGPRAAGPASALVLDWLGCVPAALVLARRSFDRQYVLRWSWSVLPLLLLGVWGACSVIWAADKFAALVGASQLVAAAAMFWSGAQLVRSWLRLRLVLSLCAGLLLALFARAVLYKAVDLPQLKDFWTEYTCPAHPDVHSKDPGTCPKDGQALVQNRLQEFRRHGWQEGDFSARQFEQKVLSGEMQGFFASPNTFAAVTVLLMVVGLGLAAQRFLDDRRDAAVVALLLLAPLGGWVIYQAGSTTGMATPVLAVALIALAWRFRGWLAAKSVRVFWVGIGLVAAGAAAVVGHGLYHGTLFHTSLTFRWHYWVGAGRIVAAHPLLGVGLDNFGLYYMAARLPVAPEEVKDPHNLLVKFAAELGVIGALLCVAWLGRLAWELTRPVTPDGPATDGAASDARAPAKGAAKEPRAAAQRPYPALRTIALVSCAGIAIGTLAGVDFTSDAVYVLTEVLARACLLAMLLIGWTVAAVRSLNDRDLDARPAPLALYGLLAALAVFVLHNLVDFSLFEAGPMMLFALLAGAAAGVRHPSVAGRKRNTPAASVALGAVVVGLLVGGGFVVLPTVVAEGAAADAVDVLRGGRPTEAVSLLNRAREQMPLNADYPYRAAQVLIAAGEGRVAAARGAATAPVPLPVRPGLSGLLAPTPPAPAPTPSTAATTRPAAAAPAPDAYDGRVPDLLALAIRTNPMALEYHLTRARYLLRTVDPAAYADQVRADFDRALALNPYDMDLHVEYADALADTLKGPADRAAAAQHYRAALEQFDRLRSDEPKKLAFAPRAVAIRAKAEALERAG